MPTLEMYVRLKLVDFIAARYNVQTLFMLFHSIFTYSDIFSHCVFDGILFIDFTLRYTYHVLSVCKCSNINEQGLR